MTPRRPYLAWAATLVVPALALAAFGWWSVEREARGRRDDARRHAVAEARRLVDEEMAELEALRAREAARPYYQFQPQYMPADALAANSPAFVPSPLMSPPEDPRVLGWFQWTLSGGVLAGPELFPGPSPAWRGRLVADFGPTLLEGLRRAPRDPGVATAPQIAVPVQTLMANEEAGQLLEEVAVATGSNRTTNYLENFRQRQFAAPASVPAPAAPATAPAPATPAPAAAGTGPAPDARPAPVPSAERPPPTAAPADVVDVRVTPYAYLLRPPGGASGPEVVAWRLVAVPGDAAKERRSVPRDRWLLQGYVLDAGRGFPAVVTPVGGDVFVARGTARAGLAVPAGSLAAASLAERLGGGRATGADPATWPGLEVLAAPDLAALDAERRASTWRWGLLATGLVLVSGIGLFVLGRTVRREMAVAERKQDFVAAVTHELKTPLATIRMYADMLKEGWVPDDGTVGDYAGRIVAETQRLATLVDQVLDLAALERGTATVHAAPGPLGPVVRDAAALVAPAAAAAGVPVVVEVAEGLPDVRFDPGLVRSLVVNLLDNAVKYSAAAPTKDVRVAVRAAAGGVEVVVADRGPGIPAAEQARLFQPFSRGGREDTRVARGVGLGLALVRRYADAHRAKVSLESAPGAGTTVTVRFPA